MKKWQKINLILFAIAIISLASLVYTLGTTNFSSPFNKPWHLLPSVHEDSLSQKYVRDYKILDQKPLLKQLYDSSHTNVFILVDAWGVPIKENFLEQDFEYFMNAPHIFALHKRLANRTKHAERVEFRTDYGNKIYLFGGDSTEYNRTALLKEIGFERTLFCQKCNDNIMIAKIDSLLEIDSLQLIVWTTQSSRSGNRDSLHKSLEQIANLALHHSDVQFVVQGAHRPILCDPETRNAYKSHWVPTVILNKQTNTD